MAITYVRSLGAVGSTSSGATSLTLSVSGGAAAGQTVLVRFAAWDYTGGGALSIADSKGNTWTRDYARIGASDGMNALYRCMVTTALVAGDTITVSFTAGAQNYAMAGDVFAGLHPVSPLWQLGADVAGSTSTPASTIVPAASPPNHTLHVAMLFYTGLASDGFTPDGDTAGGAAWGGLTAQYSGTDARAQAIQGAYKVPAAGQTGTTQTWNPTLGATRFCLLQQVIYRGGDDVAAPADRPRAARAAAPAGRLVLDVVRGDQPRATRTGSPAASVVAGLPGPTLLTDDVPRGARAGSPAGVVAVDVPVATDVPHGAGTGAPLGGLALGVTLSTDAARGVRAGSPVDGPLLIDVVLRDRPGASVSSRPGTAVLIGVTVGTDRPGTAAGGSTRATIGNTVTSDRARGVRTGAPRAALDGAGPNPLPVPSFQGNLPNPYRPVLLIEADFTAGPPQVPGSARMSLAAPSRRHIVRQWSTTRGRQYELDQVTTGTCTLDMTDPLEYLHPGNPGSPFMTDGRSIKSYRRMRLVALWPTTGNMINTAAGCDPNFATGRGRWQSLGSATRTWSTERAYQGARSLRVDQTAPGAGFGVVDRFDTAPGIVLSFSVWVWAEAGTTVYAQATDAAGTVHTSNATSAQAWTRIHLTWTCVDTLEPVVIYGVGSATPRFWADCTQLEMGLTPSEYGDTGPVPYPVYTGYIERYPLQYDHQGARGIRPLTAVDALGILSRTQVAQSYDAVVRADGATIYVPLTNSAEPTSSTDLGTGVKGRPSYQTSEKGSIGWSSDSHPDGSGAVVVSQQNPTDPPSYGWDSTQWSYLDVIADNFTLDHVGGASIEFWARPVAGYLEIGTAMVAEPGDSSVRPGETGGALRPYANVHTNGPRLHFFYNPTGNILHNYSIIALGQADTEWHHFAMTWQSGRWDCYVDGSFVSFITPSNQPSGPSLGMTLLAHVSAITSQAHPHAQVSFGRWAFYPKKLTTGTILAHYKRGTGYLSERSTDRAERLLATYWAGPRSVASGGRLRMADDHDYHGRMVLEALQEIQESERGLLYADRSGRVVFEARQTRYQDQTSRCTFGEDTAAGELPYSHYAADFDPTFTFSQVTLTRPGNDDFDPVVNTQAQLDYGQRILSHNMQADSDFQVSEAARMYLSRYGSQRVRIERIIFNPMAHPNLWPALLGLEIGSRVTVRRRAGGLVTGADYYVEQIQHIGDASSWNVELQLSPVFVPSAWVLGDSTRGVLGNTTTPIY